MVESGDPLPDSLLLLLLLAPGSGVTFALQEPALSLVVVIFFFASSW